MSGLGLLCLQTPSQVHSLMSCCSFLISLFLCRFADTVLLAVKELAVQTSDENATQVYKAAGLDLLKNINAPPKQVRIHVMLCAW